MPTIGEQLKQARETRRLTQKQAAEQTRLRLHYIDALENDDYSIMPSAAQGKGFLRIYADYLGLNLTELIASQQPIETLPDEIETDSPQPVEAEPESTPAEEEINQLALPESAEEAADIQAEEDNQVVEIIPEPPKHSELIYLELGQQLRQRRELLSLTLEEIERHTHIRKNNLLVIEAGNFDDLPSPVQARGMLSGYASFLDMNVEATLLRFADALQARRLERQPEQPQPKPRNSQPRLILPAWLIRFMTPDFIVSTALILFLFSLGIWGLLRILPDEQANLEPTEGPSISDVLLASPVASQEIILINPTSIEAVGTENLENLDGAPSETATAFVLPANLRITISIRERTFLRITVDGELFQDGRFAAGTVLTIDADDRIEILTGDGAAVQVIFNQLDFGIMGNPGEVVNRIYTVDGPQTPTPTASPLPSRTPRVTITPTPSITPSLTPSTIGE